MRILIVVVHFHGIGRAIPNDFLVILVRVKASKHKGFLGRNLKEIRVLPAVALGLKPFVPVFSHIRSFGSRYIPDSHLKRLFIRDDTVGKDHGYLRSSHAEHNPEVVVPPNGIGIR
jgi:hypothetical protein